MNKLTCNLLTAFLVVFFSIQTYAVSKALHIPWPADWQVTTPRVEKSVMYQNGRKVIDGKVTQKLLLTAINVKNGPKPMTPELLKEAAELLRGKVTETARETNIELQTFSAVQGYYFSATDKNPGADEFEQLIEGVILEQGYLINFTLLTNDAQGKEAEAMVSALNGLSIR